MILGRLACKVYGFTQRIMEVLGIACKSLLKALKPHYQKIALFSPINGGCEGFLGCEDLNSLGFHSTIDK